MARWKQKPKPTAKQKQAARQASNLANCQQGRHRLTATFRPGERVCTSCGVVFSCPDCLTQYDLPVSRAPHAYPLACATHAKAEVQV